ncbi:Rrf2 family transcriptional regulator [Pelobium manganitolerans]|uniref:Rrf2 family transcriptional regulator n=1 Tax=Pelobium manganitolerans TaxID=1842495 RepID=A0A419SB89_9SPHI|nr:Rrf2 family transcriptional regulator [Pelobium manganitolerans]RKD20068.1 Rrf2 family transcriptional regulator [Pelobium manganitolerans]
MLSNTCKTAIKAVIYLASKADRAEKAGVKEVAQSIGASEHTVSKILQNLVKQQIINSIKGPTGGFYITEAQRELPIINIVNTIDGREVFTSCGLGLKQCSSTHPCPIHHQYKVGREIIETIFTQNSINVLCQPVENGLAHLIG